MEISIMTPDSGRWFEKSTEISGQVEICWTIKTIETYRIWLNLDLSDKIKWQSAYIFNFYVSSEFYALIN